MVESSVLFVFISALLLGFLIGYLLRQSSLKKAQKRQTELQNQYQQLQATHSAQSQAWEEKLQFLQQNRQAMDAQFQKVAQTILDEKGEKLNQQSSENLGKILAPLNQQLDQFRQQLEKSHHFRLQDSARLHQQIESLTKLNQQISQDALNLTEALKGQSQTQGAWGEMILEKVLEKSGLIKGEHYHTQLSLQDLDNQRFRPDGVIHLPGEKDVIVDAKVSLVSYEAYCSTKGEAQKAEAGQAHLRSVRSHIKELQSKDYSRLPGLNSVDLVLMFLPIEGAFALALQLDPSLFQDAFERGIVLVSPTTLFATLRTIENSWRNEAQTKNSKEIALKAGRLYDKFCGFLTDLEKVEKAIAQADKACSDARNKLSHGQGNILRKTEELRELGARTQKNIPKDLIN